MKILFNHILPFSLAHGGAQIQIEQTKSALERAGLEVEFLRWWDPGQRGDVLHYFGPPASAQPDLVRQKGMKLVVTHLLGGLGVRPAWKRELQKFIIATARGTLPDGVLSRTGWNAWQQADACVAITEWEAELMRDIFGVPAGRVHVVPNGVGDFFFEKSSVPRERWLVTTASILPVKRLVETARAAISAQTPWWIIGRPFSEADSYFQTFIALCRNQPNLLRYDNAMRSQQELAAIYRQARGFVLLSRWETQSLSALEAAACECPLLLSDLPWAHSTFGDAVQFCPVTDSVEITAKALRGFYDAAPNLPPPPKPASWDDVARQLKSVYERLL
jgi:glycosyltransferase involved in cell wall biosynthesis